MMDLKEASVILVIANETSDVPTQNSLSRGQAVFPIFSFQGRGFFELITLNSVLHARSPPVPAGTPCCTPANGHARISADHRAPHRCSPP